ncbi:MAG: AbrB family transcriptional regulator [Rhodospirillaceae bacterium]|nr:AbrB family transcriptional regulator [Rhodospirillaceae bacterium]
MYTSMTSKGQVTIPKRVRDFLGLKPGAKIGFELAKDGQVVLKHSETEVKQRRDAVKTRIDRLRGTLNTGMSTDQLMKLLRD